MTDFDTKLRESLSADDEQFLKSLEDDRGLFTQLGATLHGPLKLWTRLVFVATILVSLIALYAAYRAFVAADLRETVLWAAGAVVGCNGVGMYKMWLFDRMNHLAVLRELKKIELRLSRVET